MKKLAYSLISLFVMAAVAVSCEKTQPQGNKTEETRQDQPVPENPGAEDPTPEEPSTGETAGLGKTLVVYYSFTNNTATIVSELQKQISCDVLRVEPVETGVDYAANGYAAGRALMDAINANKTAASSYPAIKTTVSNLAEYESVVVAAPLWYSHMAAFMQTFLFTYGSQMAGKNVGLIVSSASSGISGVSDDARRLVPDAKWLSKDLYITSGNTSRSATMLENWLNEVVK